MIYKKQSNYFSVKECKMNPNTLYIFGDNSLRYGNAGQAVIRKCQNSFGISTKNAPGLRNEDFFNDLDQKGKVQIEADILTLKKLLKSSDIIKTVIFPADGLGTGLSQMPTRCPETFKYLNDRIFQEFNIDLNIKK